MVFQFFLAKRASQGGHVCVWTVAVGMPLGEEHI